VEAIPQFDAARQAAVLRLLDDGSAPVRQALLAYLGEVGAPAEPFLRRIASGSDRPLAGHAAWYLRELKFNDPVAEFRGFIRSLNYELETGALLLARTVSPRLDIGACCAGLDAIAARCRELIAEPSSRREKCRLVNRVLFHEWGFRGDRDHYNDPRNSLLDLVLTRRKGIPISLSIVYLLVAERLDLDLQPVALPGHFLVACFSEGAPFFIDPFDQGLFRSRDEVMALLRSNQIEPQAGDLARTPVREVLCRCCRNLVKQYGEAGDVARARLFASFIEEFDAAYAR
jgi:regulator of sirC expression with transglutaminase-like and TPR domain